MPLYVCRHFLSSDIIGFLGEGGGAATYLIPIQGAENTHTAQLIYRFLCGCGCDCQFQKEKKNSKIRKWTRISAALKMEMGRITPARQTIPL
jgi:hypothetical protein